MASGSSSWFTGVTFLNPYRLSCRTKVEKLVVLKASMFSTEQGSGDRTSLSKSCWLMMMDSPLRSQKMDLFNGLFTSLHSLTGKWLGLEEAGGLPLPFMLLVADEEIVVTLMLICITQELEGAEKVHLKLTKVVLSRKIKIRSNLNLIAKMFDDWNHLGCYDKGVVIYQQIMNNRWFNQL